MKKYILWILVALLVIIGIANIFYFTSFKIYSINGKINSSGEIYNKICVYEINNQNVGIITRKLLNKRAIIRIDLNGKLIIPNQIALNIKSIFQKYKFEEGQLNLTSKSKDISNFHAFISVIVIEGGVKKVKSYNVLSPSGEIVVENMP